MKATLYIQALKVEVRGIYFCGDYLENPSTEDALTSSIKLLQKIR